MTDQAAQLHDAALRQSNGPRVDVLHSAAQQNRQAFPARGGVLDRKPVVRGYPHQHDATAQASHLAGLGDRVTSPGSLDGHIHTSTVRLSLHPRYRVLVAAIDGNAAQPLGQRQPPREPVGNVDGMGTGEPHQLQNQKADRSRTQDSHAMRNPCAGEIGGVDRHAQWLQQRGLDVIDSVGHRKAAVRRHVHPLAKTTIVGIVAAEPEVAAQIRMPVHA
jgi:hypothetical protein